ncbi:hypothetical protein GCK72_002785 [Caenorhabditis remanei]|uniref:Uncharacterized protein n=1 Tax=Caenorhabditis remanei TaxID=31234 RepID=A0A6A5HUX3_CAERE|nr:hypothetical protein GCK72_002785 [Caenorhabditis remanei]KAF1770961.1 hypothetical protein GCK72_002785 [Caenorhabditis remanei]
MNRKPLNYDCFEVVLQYFEANDRINLSTHCPAIRNAYKRCPLKIEKLKLNPYSIEINDTEYRLGVIHHFPNGNTPKCYERDNNEGGVQLTIDRYGVTDKLSENTLTPGDINLHLVPNRPLIEYESHEILQFVLSEFELNDPTRDRSQDNPRSRCYEHEQRELRIHNSKDRPDALKDLKLSEYVWFDEIIDYVNLKYKCSSSFNIYNVHTNQEKTGLTYTCVGKPSLSIAHSDMSKEKREYLVDKLHALILPLETRSLFNCYIQMTISSPRGITKERLIIDRKLPEAIKYLMKKILGTRRDFIHVKNLEIYDKGGIIRLEENLRFKVNNFRFGSGISRVMKQVEHIFHESSFPLKSIEIFGRRIIQTARIPLVTTAEMIHLTDWYQRLYFIELLEFKNKMIRMKFGCFYLKQYLELVEKLVENPREIGTCFSFGIRTKWTSKEIIETFKTFKTRDDARFGNIEWKGCSYFSNCFNYPLTNRSELNVYGQESTDPKVLWVLNFEVMPVGSAFYMDR